VTACQLPPTHLIYFPAIYGLLTLLELEELEVLGALEADLDELLGVNVDLLLELLGVKLRVDR
jgi:hypothetical protein